MKLKIFGMEKIILQNLGGPSVNCKGPYKKVAELVGEGDVTVESDSERRLKVLDRCSKVGEGALSPLCRRSAEVGKHRERTLRASRRN